MNFNRIYLIVLVLFIIISCKKEEDIIASQEMQNLTGYWVSQQLYDTLFTCEKSDELVANEYGFAFLPGGKFIERKNSGWCGTPPISYADFEGNWSLNDSIVDITCGYWGGSVSYQWRVVSVDYESLSIDVISEVYSQEN